MVLVSGCTKGLQSCLLRWRLGLVDLVRMCFDGLGTRLSRFKSLGSIELMFFGFNSRLNGWGACTVWMPRSSQARHLQIVADLASGVRSMPSSRKTEHAAFSRLKRCAPILTVEARPWTYHQRIGIPIRMRV